MNINKGIELRENGKTEEALNLLLKLLDKGQNNAEILYQIAWCLDILEREKEAIPYYEKAIEIGMDDEKLKGALLGLGSTYRTIGEYQSSLKVFDRAVLQYPTNKEFKVFRAMTNYNLGNHEDAMRALLEIIADISSDENVNAYKKAILFYSDKLNKVWK